MLKLLLKLSSIAALVAPLVITKGAIAIPGDPDLYCFRTLQNGQVVDLRGLCKQSTTLKKAPALGVIKNRVRLSQEALKKFEFLEYSYDGAMFVAKVKSKTKEPINNASISFDAYNQNGNRETLIDTGTAITNLKVLKQGAVTSFKAKLDKEADFIQITTVESD